MKKKKLIIGNENIILLFLSALILISINYLYPGWFIDPFHRVDPWLYYGTGEYFDYIKKHFYDTYYFRRWTINLGNLIFSNIFGPFYGMFILKSLTFFFGLFFLQKTIFKISSKSYLVVFILAFFPFLFHKQLLETVGTSYVPSLSFLLFSLYFYFLITHKNQSNNVTLIAFLISLILITYQGNIKFIIPSLILFFFDENFNFLFDKFILKKIGKLIFWTIVFTILIDESIQFFLSIDLKNFFIYSISTELYVRDKFIVGYNTFYQDLFPRIYKITYITGAVLSVLVILNFKIIKNNLLKKVWLFYIIFSLMNLLEPFHKLGFSIYIQAKWLHLLLSVILSVSFLIFLFYDFNNKISKKDHQKSYYILTKFIINLSIIIFLIFANFKSGNDSHKLSLQTKAEYIKQKSKLYKIYKENKKITDLALKLDKRISIVDDRPHYGWSGNIAQLYGMYSALALGYPPKFESCNLVDWQLGYDPLIILFSNKNINDSLELIKRLSGNCKFNGRFEFKEEIDKNVKIFVIKN